MPSSSHIGISRRIEDETERGRLKRLVHDMRKDNFGYIIRTAAEGESEEKIVYEMGFLTNLWENSNASSRRPQPLPRSTRISPSACGGADLLIHEVEKLVIDSRPTYEAVLSFLDTYMPSLKDNVILYGRSEPVFDAYNLEGDISRR